MFQMITAVSYKNESKYESSSEYKQSSILVRFYKNQRCNLKI